MKFFSRIKLTLENIRNSIERFPITILISTIITILLIYLEESTLNGITKENIERVALVLGLGIPMSLSIGLGIERFFNNNKRKYVFLYALGAGVLVAYYFLFLQDYEMVSMSRYMGSMLFLILSSLYMQRIRKSENYEYNIMDIWSGFSLTFIYSFVLYFGIAVIFFTIGQLFDINIQWKLYYYMFLVVALIFGVALFLSKLPTPEEHYERTVYPKALKILLLYIVIPLISIYTIILYVYFGKILITREWPRGLVSHLVLWYSTLSVGVIFLITPMIEENRTARLFRTLFPKINIPVLLMMFMSIYQRINQYGITENRYYIVALGLWVFGIMAYFSFKKDLKNIVIPISLSMVLLNSVYGPLSGFSISKHSQNKRFESILIKNSMFNGKEIRRNVDISPEDKREINNILAYFRRNHKIEDVKALPKDFELSKMESVMGFEYEPNSYYPAQEYQYFFFGIADEENPMDIKNYDYYIKMSSWNEDKKQVDELLFQYDGDKNALMIWKDENIIVEHSMMAFIKDLYENQKIENLGKSRMSYEDMSYETTYLEDGKEIKLKFIFSNINGRVDSNNDIFIDSMDFILLISNSNEIKKIG